ncbi:MAG: polysaccharide biosynthesis C-terminal domain-containing protein, partial [Saprospiraceae bacterium]|nr:polysaccharide biosynthesis C-terminal domain-containing protein [Saprospiraceae bacterium]
KLFSDDISIIQQTSQYFYIVSLSYILYGLYLVTSSIFNGLERPSEALGISCARSFLFTLPLTWIGSHWGVLGIFAGLSFSNLLAGIYASWRMRKELDRVQSKLLQEPVLSSYWKDITGIFNG